MKGKTTEFLLIAALILATLAIAGYVVTSGSPRDARATINHTLVGTNLTYFSIAGKPLDYTIAPEDIVSIEPVSFEGKDAWKVRVGQSLSWDLTMNAKGTAVLKVEQLFQT